MNLVKFKINLLLIVLFFISFSTEGFDIASALTFLFIPFINFKNIVILFKNSLLFKTLFIFYIFCFVSIATNKYEINQGVRFFSTFLLFIYISSNKLFNGILFIKYLKIIIYGLLIQNIIALYLVFVKGIIVIPGFKPFLLSFRYQGFYNLTILAIFLSALLLCILATRNLLKSLIIKILVYLFFPICIVLSLTRSAWLVFCIGIFFLILFESNFRISNFFKYIKVIGVLFFIIGVCFSISAIFITSEYDISDLLKNRIFNDTIEKSNNAEIERGNFTYPLTLIKKIGIRPFGIGLGQTEKIGGHIFSTEEGNLGSHNTFAQILLDFGFLPFVFFISFNFLLIINFIQNFNDIRQSYIYGCFIGFLALFFGAMYQDLVIYLPIAIFPIFSICYFLFSNQTCTSKTNSTKILF